MIVVLAATVTVILAVIVTVTVLVIRAEDLRNAAEDGAVSPLVLRVPGHGTDPLSLSLSRSLAVYFSLLGGCNCCRSQSVLRIRTHTRAHTRAIRRGDARRLLASSSCQLILLAFVFGCQRQENRQQQQQQRRDGDSSNTSKTLTTATATVTVAEMATATATSYQGTRLISCTFNGSFGPLAAR